MRKPFVVALVFLVGCSSNAAAPTTITTVVENTVPRTTSTTTTTLPTSAIRLSPVEAYAAGATGVEVTYPGGSVQLNGLEPQPIAAAPGTRLDIAYPNGPAWTQTLTAETIIAQPWRRPAPAGRKAIAVAWQVNGDIDTYLDQLEVAAGLDVASPRWWRLDESGALVGEGVPEYAPAAAAAGVDLWPYITNGFEPARTRAAIGTAAGRVELASAVSESARMAGVAGVNVDFESFDSTEREAFTTFVAELTRRVHEWGGVTSVDVTVLTAEFATIDESELPIYDRRRLAEAADFLVLMAYDQHSTPRPYGPTASPAWVEAGLRSLLRDADPHQVILGVPFYSRIWTPDDPTARAITVTSLLELAAGQPGRYDERFDLDRITLDDGRFFWREDYGTLEQRLRLVKEAGLAGWAAWRLGFDSADLWEQVPLP